MDKKEALNNIFNKVLELNLKGHKLIFEMSYISVDVYDPEKFKNTGIGRISDYVFFNSEYDSVNMSFEKRYNELMEELNKY